MADSHGNNEDTADAYWKKKNHIGKILYQLWKKIKVRLLNFSLNFVFLLL